MELQNKPYGLLSAFSFILAGGTFAYYYVRTEDIIRTAESLNSVPIYLVIFFAVIGCMLAATSFFAKKK